MGLGVVSLMLVLLVYFVSRAQKLSNYTDQQSLLAFKSYITSDPYRVLETWASNVPLCNWRGVICSATKHRVTTLNLDNLSLVGTISPHIGNLSFLSALHLAGNSFSGKIPYETGNLFRLKTLNITSNHLEGSIPSSIGLCFQLIVLDLSSNNLEGTIPTELGNLGKLDVLMVSSNFLTGYIPSSFRNLSSLTNMLLFENSLTGPIPESLGDLPLLVNIDLTLNQLEGEIPRSIFNQSSLMQLALGGNRLSGILPSDMFSKLKNLMFFTVGQNRLSGNVPVSFGNASSLVRADFSRNNFSGNVPLMWNLPNVQFLSFDTNYLTSEGENGWDFLTSLTNSTQLQVFSLAGNLLSGKIPSSIGNLSRYLSLFVIGGNNIEGNLPSQVSNLVGLTELSVEFNSFYGKIPSSIGNLPVLQNLYLNANNFSGVIPDSLGNLTYLSEMALGGNTLSGTIPSFLGTLRNLQALDLSGNKLIGKIPIDIFTIPNLARVLNLSFNSLVGQIPEQIGNLKMIQAIDLSSNNFTGYIPLSIGGCSSLEQMNLSHNSLHGGIPTSLSDMKGIEFIDLSFNKLNGSIPPSLGTLRYLEFLDISMNNLEGSIPSWGVFANTNEVSLSGNPRLCGGVPGFNLPKCSLPSTKHVSKLKTKQIIGLVFGLVGFFLILGLVIFQLSRKGCHKKTTTETDVASPNVYSYYDIKSATGNFSAVNLIGQGSFGSVYKAIFSEGSVSAVKVFNLEQHGASKSFIAECEALRNVRHRNLVKITSTCSSGTFKALILPLMPNGSLEKWLHNRSEISLSLRQRLEIAKEVASALEYLHHDCETPIVHCDLKPSNVLLDEYMCAKVADFGIARILNAPNNQSISSTLGLKGSIGYIAPEYGLGVAVSTKGDVYSFGILLLELFTCRRPTDEEFIENIDLQGWVSKSLHTDLAHILDDILVGDRLDLSYNGRVINILQLALRCAMTAPDARPTMRDVSLLIRKLSN